MRVTFPAELATTAEPLIRKPQWDVVPTREQLSAAFPAQAAQTGVLSARVVLNCSVAAEGRLDRCEAVNEDPVGLGFRESVLGLAQRFRVMVWTDEGLPSVGGRVRVPGRFDVSPPKAGGAP